VSSGGRLFLSQFVYDRSIAPPHSIGRFDLSAMP